MKLLIALLTLSISFGNIHVAAKADIAAIYKCMAREGSLAPGVPNKLLTSADFERAARSELTSARSEEACDKKTGDRNGDRRYFIEEANSYAIAAEYYRCAGDTLLAADSERKTRSLLDAAEPPHSATETRNFKLILQMSEPAPSGRCWVNRSK